MLSQSGIHAIRAMVTLADLPAEPTAAWRKSPARPVAEQLSRQAPASTLPSRSRDSRKGLGGGFPSLAPCREIRLIDVMASIEDVGRWSACVFTTASARTTPVHGPRTREPRTRSISRFSCATPPSPSWRPRIIIPKKSTLIEHNFRAASNIRPERSHCVVSAIVAHSSSCLPRCSPDARAHVTTLRGRRQSPAIRLFRR